MVKHAEILLLEGADAGAFAHAQFSSKVDALQVAQWQFSSWLDAKGRVRCLFHLVRLGENKYIMLLRGGDAASLADALRRFVFRAKLTIKALPPNTLATGSALPLHITEQVGDVLLLGCGTHSMQMGALSSNNGAWPLLQLRMGWPWLPASTLDQLLPAALSLQRLAAVVVDKGCYPGQEIVARLHFRGGHKRHLHSGTSSQRLLAGQVLRIDGKDVGLVLDALSDDAGTAAQFVLNDEVAQSLLDGRAAVFDEGVQVNVSAPWSV